MARKNKITAHAQGSFSYLIQEWKDLQGEREEAAEWEKEKIWPLHISLFPMCAEVRLITVAPPTFKAVLVPGSCVSIEQISLH